MAIIESTLVLLALLVACITLFVQREHNRKQLLPILSIELEQNNKNNEQFNKFCLINNGHGVAIIDKFEIILETGKSIELTHEYSFRNLILEEVPDLKQVSNSLPSTLAPNSRECLYSFTTRSNARHGLFGSKVTIVARSVYGDIVTVDNRGFKVTSNLRDAVFENILKSATNMLVSILHRRS